MQVHNLTQGSPEWHAYRRNHFNASDAPAMLGCSPYKTRDQLIAELATGIVPEADAATQRVFDAGHRFESLARPLVEKIIGEELAPLVGSNGKYSASFDGVTLMGDTGWEHKSLNAELRAAMVDGCTGADLPKVYRVQMEQQCMVEESLARVLFTASKWNGDELVEARHCWYTPDAILRAEIVAGWAQLEKDVAAYVPSDAAPQKVVAETVTALPTVFAQVTGSIALKDNLPEYEVALRDFIDHRLITKPESDQDFANLDLQIKALKGAEAALDASEEQALSQAEMLSAFKRQKDMLHKLTRDTRLAAEKLLTAEKERIKLEQVQRGQKEFAAHIAGLNTRLGKPYMPTVASDFPGAIKGKRTVDSLRDAVSTELARAKIAANEIADRIQVNLGTLRELATAHAFLFADTAQIVLKAPDDVTTLVKARIAEHEASEARRLDAERERIRSEEQVKAQRAASEAEEQRERERLEERRQQLLQKERDDQAAIAAAAASQQIAAPLADDLSNLAREKSQEAVAGIDASQAITIAQRAAAAGPAVAPLRPVAAVIAPTTAPSLKLGQITERLGFALSADFLRGLGFEPAAKVGAHGVYHEAQFPHMLAALVHHIEGVQAKAAA
ncbi:YqaJ viral recombinase family protein [Acidovorax sp. LjRoot74]|uniref:YqaJ viral recombinase family protein n=1 Tax=Acidovorax sp. LjRoot74 TaxID=3342337 RepID=UPI003ECED1DB